MIVLVDSFYVNIGSPNLEIPHGFLWVHVCRLLFFVKRFRVLGNKALYKCYYYYINIYVLWILSFFVGQTENWPLSSTITEPLVWDNAPGKGDYKMLRIQVSDFTYMYW